MKTHSELITPTESAETSFSHLRSGNGKPIARSQNKRKSRRDSGVVQDSHSEN